MQVPEYVHTGPSHSFGGHEVVYPNPSTWAALSAAHTWVHLPAWAAYVLTWKHQGAFMTPPRIERSQCPRSVPALYPSDARLEWCGLGDQPPGVKMYTLTDLRRCPLEARKQQLLTEDDVYIDRLCAAQLIASLYYRRPQLCPLDVKPQIIESFITREVKLFIDRLHSCFSAHAVTWLQWMMTDLDIPHTLCSLEDACNADSELAHKLLSSLPPVEVQRDYFLPHWTSLRRDRRWLRLPFEWVAPHLIAHREVLLHRGWAYLHIGQALTHCLPRWYELHVRNTMSEAASCPGVLTNAVRDQLRALLPRYQRIWIELGNTIRRPTPSLPLPASLYAIEAIAPPCVLKFIRALTHPERDTHKPGYLRDANRVLLYRTLLGVGVSSRELEELMVQRIHTLYNASEEERMTAQAKLQIRYWTTHAPIIPRCTALLSAGWCGFTDVEDLSAREQCARTLPKTTEPFILTDPGTYISTVRRRGVVQLEPEEKGEREEGEEKS